MTSVAVLVVAFNGVKYLQECLASVFAAESDGLSVHFVVVDNASTDGTSDYVKANFPECVLLHPGRNLGFAEGNNYGWRAVQQQFPDCEFLYLLNQDTVVDNRFLVQAIDYLAKHPNVGAVQSLLLLHPEVELINTAGNQLHYLGFGLPSHYRQPRIDAPMSGLIGYPSGAAMMIRTTLVTDLGLFHPDLFMYLEDAEIGLKLHLIDRPPHLCASSIVFHKYQFRSTLASYGYLERNRLWLLAVHYQALTLILLSPAILLMELGQILFATRQGMLRSKLWAVKEFFRPSFFISMLRQRQKVQTKRIVRDKQLFAIMTGQIDSPHLNSSLLRYVANPVFEAYFRLIKFFVGR